MQDLDWLDGENIRPYVFVRKDNCVQDPGSHFELDWFPFEPILLDPLKMDQLCFANHILNMEALAFKTSKMSMSRWVFYDCAIMPGFVVGFAHRTSTLPKCVQKALGVELSVEWTPISLFVVIPAVAQKEWVAHNLCSVNILLEKDKRYYGLGFLTKAFGLWYTNIHICCGITQWTNPAIRLHAHYGEMEILTAYTPIHDYPQTLTYRLNVDTRYWEQFFTGQSSGQFIKTYQKVNLEVKPQSKSSLIELQKRIERQEGPFFLRPLDIRTWSPDQVLPIYTPSL